MTSTANTLGVECVEALLQRVDTNLPFRTGEPSPLACRNLETTQECVVTLSRTHHNHLITGLVKIIRQVSSTYIARNSHNVLEIEENYRHSVRYLLETILRCILFGPNLWSEGDSIVARLLFNECAKLTCIFAEKPFWVNEIDLIGKLVAELSRRSFLAALLFVQQLFSESHDFNEEAASSSNESSDPLSLLMSSFSLIQHFDFDLKLLKRFLEDFADKIRPSSSSNRKVVFSLHLVLCAPHVAILLWRCVDLRMNDFLSIHLNKQTDDFYDSCSRIFDCCQTTASSDKISKIGRQSFDKEKMRQQLWPLMMACIVFSPKLTINTIVSNEDASAFIETLRSKLKRSHDYEFAAPILARFCSSIGRIPLVNDQTKQLLHSSCNELRSFLLDSSKKTMSKGDRKTLEDCCIQTLSICLNLGIVQPAYFNPDDLLQEMLAPAYNEPLQGFMGPTVVCSALRVANSSTRSTSEAALAAASGRLCASFFTVLTTSFLSSSSSSQTGAYDQLNLPSSVHAPQSSSKGRALRIIRSAPVVVDENQAIMQFLDLFIAAPKLVALSTEKNDPILLSDLLNSICRLLDYRIFFKKCVRAIENLCTCMTISSAPHSQIQMLMIPVDAFSKRLILGSSTQTILIDYISALKVLSHRLFEVLSFLRNESLSNEQTFLKDSVERFERALLCRVWTPDISTVTIILDCMANLCRIADCVCQGEDLAVMHFFPNLHSYADMSNEKRRQSVSLGRVALQKHVLTSLRTLRYPSKSVIDVWENVFSIWRTKSPSVLRVLKNSDPLETISSSPSGSLQDISVSPVSRVQHQNRRSSYATVSSPALLSAEGDPLSEAAVEELLVEWSHMTYFLAALADAYLKHQIYLRKTGGTQHLAVALSVDAALAKANNGDESNHLNIYVNGLLRMLVHTSEEKYGARVERVVRESLGGDLRPSIQSIVIEEAHKLVTKCVNMSNQIVVAEQHTLFVGNIIRLFKMMFDKPSLSNRMDVQVSATLEDCINVMTHYVRQVGSAKLHMNLCHLLLTILSHREEMAGYRFETKLRAKVVDYLLKFPTDTPTDLALLQLKTMSFALAKFPLIMDASGENVDHSHRLRLLKSCTEFIEEKSVYLSKKLQSSAEVEEHCLQALLSLLNFNNDLGLSASLYLIMVADSRVRSAYLEALARFIRQGISSGNAAARDDSIDDEFASLAELVTMLDDKGDLPVVMALVEVVPAYQLYDLARLLTHLFDAKHLLAQLVINVLTRELSCSPVDTVLRGSNLASSLLSYSFQTFGSYYVTETIGPIAKRLMSFDNSTLYEVNPEQLGGDANIEEHRTNLKNLTSEVLSSLVSNQHRFPAKLRSLCRCVYDVLSERCKERNIIRLTGGTLVFLRFVNPFLTSSYEFGLCDRPSKHVQRAFTLVAKLLQSAANGQPLKEDYMKPLNDFTISLRDDIEKFVNYLINSDEGADSSPAASSLFLGECVRYLLHYFMYNNQDRVADCLRERRLVGRKPRDRLEALLNKMGPVELSLYLASYSSNGNAMRLQSTHSSQQFIANDRLEPFLAEQMEKLREAKVFYQSGTSANGNPVFYFIPKHTRSLLSDFSESFSMNVPGNEALANLIIAMLKPYNASETKWELIVDLTQAPVGVLFKSDLLQRLSAIPETVLSNLTALYIYQCSPIVADYTQLHDRFITYLRQNVGCRFMFPANLSELRTYVPQLKMPPSSVALDEHSQLFEGGSRFSRHKIFPANIQTNECAIKISTADRVRLFAGCSLYVVEVFVPEEVEDIQLDDAKQQITIIQRTEPVPVVFSHTNASDIFESLASFREKVASAKRLRITRSGNSQDYTHAYHSRSFLTARMTGNHPVRLRDISAFLLVTGFTNVSSAVANVQSSALNLITSLCHRFDLLSTDNTFRLTNLLRVNNASNGTLIKVDDLFPSVWSSEVVSQFSASICQSAPWLLLDFVAATSYYLAAESQHPHVKAALCECLLPWLEQLKVRQILSGSETAATPLGDAIGSLIGSFIDVSSNATFASSVFGKLDVFFDTIFESVLSLQSAILPNDKTRRNNALVVLLKTARNDPETASKVVVRHISDMLLNVPTKLNSKNYRIAFFVRAVNAFLAEDLIRVDENVEYYVHFALTLTCSQTQVAGSAIFALLYNAIRSFAVSSKEAQVQRLVSEMTEPKFSEIFTDTPNATGDNWVSLLEFLVDLVALVDNKVACLRWAEVCRKIIETSLNINSPLAPSVRVSVRILGLLSALPPANMVQANTINKDVEIIMLMLSGILTQEEFAPNSQSVSTSISGALSFFSRITSSVPLSLIALLGDFFWLAIAFLQSSEPSIYADALFLVDVAVSSLWARTSCPLDTVLSCYQRHVQVFSQSFANMLPAAISNGLDLRDHIHFVLARLLFKSIDHPDEVVSAYASRLLLRLHQPSFNTPVVMFSSESKSAITVVYSLVAHVLSPDNTHLGNRRQNRGSSAASTSAISSSSNGVPGYWDDRLCDIDRLDEDEKASICAFLLSLLLTNPNKQQSLRPILMLIVRVLRESSMSWRRIDALTRIPSVRQKLAEILRTTHDSDTLETVAQMLERVVVTMDNQDIVDSDDAVVALFHGLNEVPMSLVPKQNTEVALSQLDIHAMTSLYSNVYAMIVDGAICDCSQPAVIDS